MTYEILDGLGWGLSRRDRGEEAMKVFRKNLQEFPDEYIPNESMGDALWFGGRQVDGMKVFEAWLERHPDHEMARRRLTNMKAEVKR